MRLGKDRLWLVGGLLAAAVLFAAGWFFVISPQRSQAQSLREQAATAQLNLASLRHRLTDLEQQSANLDQYRAELARDRRALPATPSLAEFLRELQSAGDSARVTVTGLIVGAPTQTDAAGTKVISLPVTLTVSASADRLGLFLDQVQRVQPRAILITTASAVPDQKSRTLDGLVALTLTLQAFVDPATS